MAAEGPHCAVLRAAPDQCPPRPGHPWGEEPSACPARRGPAAPGRPRGVGNAGGAGPPPLLLPVQDPALVVMAKGPASYPGAPGPAPALAAPALGKGYGPPGPPLGGGKGKGAPAPNVNPRKHAKVPPPCHTACGATPPHGHFFIFYFICHAVGQ